MNMDNRYIKERGKDLVLSEEEYESRWACCSGMANAFFATSKENQLAGMDKYYKNK